MAKMNWTKVNDQRNYHIGDREREENAERVAQYYAQPKKKEHTVKEKPEKDDEDWEKTQLTKNKAPAFLVLQVSFQELEEIRTKIRYNSRICLNVSGSIQFGEYKGISPSKVFLKAGFKYYSLECTDVSFRFSNKQMNMRFCANHISAIKLGSETFFGYTKTRFSDFKGKVVDLYTREKKPDMEFGTKPKVFLVKSNENKTSRDDHEKYDVILMILKISDSENELLKYCSEETPIVMVHKLEVNENLLDRVNMSEYKNYDLILFYHSDYYICRGSVDTEKIDDNHCHLQMKIVSYQPVDFEEYIGLKTIVSGFTENGRVFRILEGTKWF